MSEARISEVLIINVSRIGDTLLCTPAIRAIAAAYPGARVTCLAHPNRAEVLLGLPFIHKVGSITKHRAAFRGWLGGKPFDIAFVFGFDKALVRYALRAARRVVAYRQDEPRLDRRLDPAVPVPAPMSRHAVRMQLSLPEALGIPDAGLHLSYRVLPEEAGWAEGELAPLVAKGARPLIGLQIASFPTKAFRDWPVEQFIELCRRIRAEHPAAHFLIFGGSLERERTQALHAAFPDCSTHYAGRLTLRRTAALMDRLDLYVGVDTGPTHIMGALHRPMVAMYHGSSPSRFLAPLDHPCLHVVDHPRADRGCTTDDSMAEIPVEAVLAKVREALP